MGSKGIVFLDKERSVPYRLLKVSNSDTCFLESCRKNASLGGFLLTLNSYL